MRASQQFIATFGQQHPAARLPHVGEQDVAVDAFAVEQVGFRGPADPAGVAPVSRRDQRQQGLEVGLGGIAEAQRPGRQHSSLRTLASAAMKASISAWVL